MAYLDYLLYISNKFLVYLKKVNDVDIMSRSLTAVTFMLFFIALFIFSAIYMILIVQNILVFHRWLYFTLCISTFIISHSLIKRRYSHSYDSMIEDLDSKYSYNKTRIVITFIIIWILPILIFWGGLLVLRNFIYR